ncbi:MAG: hypothetical protein AB1439_10735 [candidate division FCPU426 bacterium]
MEPWLYAALLAVHNLVLVIFGGGMFSVWLLNRKRSDYDRTSLHPGDHLLEASMIAHPDGYLRGLIMLALTGGGMPLVHFLYHGHIKPQTAVSWSAFGFKGVLVTVLFVVLIRWLKQVELPLGRAYAEAKAAPTPANCQRYFELSARRTRWCLWGWVVALLVLLVTPLVTFFQG